MRSIERQYHVHILTGFDIDRGQVIYMVFSYDWKKAFNAFSVKGLKKGLAMHKKYFESVYSNWGFAYEY